MFHRFRIGTMAATIVSDGPLVLPAAAKIFRGPGQEALDAAVTAAGSAPTPCVSSRTACCWKPAGEARAVRQRHGDREALWPR